MAQTFPLIARLKIMRNFQNSEIMLRYPNLRDYQLAMDFWLNVHDHSTFGKYDANTANLSTKFNILLVVTILCTRFEKDFQSTHLENEKSHSPTTRTGSQRSNSHCGTRPTPALKTFVQSCPARAESQNPASLISRKIEGSWKHIDMRSKFSPKETPKHTQWSWPRHTLDEIDREPIKEELTTVQRLPQGVSVRTRRAAWLAERTNTWVTQGELKSKFNLRKWEWNPK